LGLLELRNATLCRYLLHNLDHQRRLRNQLEQNSIQNIPSKGAHASQQAS